MTMDTPSTSTKGAKGLASRAQLASTALSEGEHPIGALRKVKPDSSSTADTMAAWRAFRDATRRTVLSTYQILGFLSSGTYGRVYKACLRNPNDNSGKIRLGTPIADSDGAVFAIKKFKPDKDTDSTTYTGISQSAMREIALNRELRHENIVTLREVMLEDRSIYMVFSYASHDFLQVIHHHSAHLRTPIPGPILKSLLFQLLSGVHYLHSNWVLHRDLKPANILLTSSGVVKIGDLGLARLYSQPLQPLYNGDKVVVTIWYRAPELLMGTRHYTPAIDMWAIGCIWGELLGLRPLFKGEEAKADHTSKAKGANGSSSSVLQTDQMARIIEVLGTPTTNRWPAMEMMPDYRGYWQAMRLNMDTHQNVLFQWYTSRFRSQAGYGLLESLLQYDPLQRKTAKEALDHEWFKEDPLPTRNAFASLASPTSTYPQRRLHSDTTDPVMAVDPAQAAAQQQQQQQQQQQAAAAQQAAAQQAQKVQQPPTVPIAVNAANAIPLGGPPAPAPAPASVGSLPNSVGSAGASGGGGGGGGAMLSTINNAALGISASGFTGASLGLGSTATSSTQPRGGMVGTAAANATREQANKRAKLG